MNYLGDYHAHTTYADGHSSADEMVRAAYEMGLKYFGLSEHLYEDGAKFGVRGKTIDKYLADMDRLKVEYRDKMEVFCGFECEDYDSHLFITEEQRSHVDYWIRSTHTIYQGEKAQTVDESLETLFAIVNFDYGGDWYSMLENYYINFVSKVNGHFDYTIIGHFDEITKFNQDDCLFDTHCDRYREAALYALRELAKTGLPFEINTGAISRGYRKEPYPQDWLLKELYNIGGKIILTSDSHHASQICGAFDTGAKLAYECGFRTRYLLTGDGLKEIDLC